MIKLQKMLLDKALSGKHPMTVMKVIMAMRTMKTMIQMIFYEVVLSTDALALNDCSAFMIMIYSSLVFRYSSAVNTFVIFVVYIAHVALYHFCIALLLQQ